MEQSKRPSADISKFISDNLDVVSVSRQAFNKFYINAHPNKHNRFQHMFETLSTFIRAHNATIVSQDVYGSCKLHRQGMTALKKLFGQINWPVTWLEGYGPGEKTLTGTQIYAVSQTNIEHVKLDGQFIGNTFEDKDAKYCILGNLKPTDATAPKNIQARQTFEKMQTALNLVGMDFSNIVRTWLYINDILSWYDEFNKIRTAFFEEQNLFQKLVPASTGIGVVNPAGTAMTTELLAIKPKNQNVLIRPVPSPLQCPAVDYKSSFSRAVEITLSDHRRLYISGTASIAPNGKTAHIGDVEKQIARTMEVVQAILKSCKMTWDNTSRAIAYFKNIDNLPLLDKYCSQNSLPPMPIAAAHGEICRENLLFEIEIDAVTANNK